MSVQAGPVWIVGSSEGVRSMRGRFRASGALTVALVWGRPMPAASPGGALRAFDAEGTGIVLLTSASAPACMAEARGEGRPAACVGPVTARAAEAAGFDVVLVGRTGVVDLAARVRDLEPTPSSVLWLRGEDVRPETRPAFAKHGLTLHEVATYRMERNASFAAAVAAAPTPAGIVFGSPRAVEALHTTRVRLADSLTIYTPGETTARRVRALYPALAAIQPLPAATDDEQPSEGDGQGEGA